MSTIARFLNSNSSNNSSSRNSRDSSNLHLSSTTGNRDRDKLFLEWADSRSNNSNSSMDSEVEETNS